MKQKNIVLMVVAVGCGLVAAFLTSQMSAKPVVEKVEVIVAAKDLPVGTQVTKDELKNMLTRKAISKDAVPPTIIESEEELLDKRLVRTIHKDEMFTKADVTKGVVVSIPPGQSMVTLPIGLAGGVAGFVTPGSKVDVLASVRLENRLIALPILVNMLVLAVDGNVQAPQGQGSYQTLSMVSFAVDRKQALLIKLAQARNCDMSLLLRNGEDKETENDKFYKIDQVLELLRDSKNPADIKDPAGEGTKVRPDGSPEMAPMTAVAPAPPKVEMVKVPAAAEDIAAGTQITNDLIAEKFKLIELPKDIAADAVTDLAPLAGDKQVLKTGLGKGQWVTKSLFGSAEPKPGPQQEFVIPKPGPTEKPVETKTDKKTRDVAIHSGNGTKYFRYEETPEGGWKLLGEVFPNQKTEKKTPTPEKVD